MSDKWYYDLQTHEVTQGISGGWENRMGPYDSREQAEHALAIAAERSRAADDYDDED